MLRSRSTCKTLSINGQCLSRNLQFVEHLRGFDADLHDAGQLEQTIRKRVLAVVHMRYDAEIADAICTGISQGMGNNESEHIHTRERDYSHDKQVC